MITGAIFFFIAPWPVRFFDYLDRLLMRALLAPDAMTVRVRTLEQARAQTVDASAATLRRIERDLHDGTQAQLVALAMRLGMAKEKLSDPDHLDIDQVRDLVNDAHKGAKEAIVELRDLARGIHPPALDVGLEGALATLAARSTIPTELTVTIDERPSPAIEAIAYFCVAELMANVAQHAFASRASVSCAQQGRWLRLVVRDDGVGGAQAVSTGSTSSGLSGLADRVRTVRRKPRGHQPPTGAHGRDRRSPPPGLADRAPPSRHRRGLGHPPRRARPAARRPRIRGHRRGRPTPPRSGRPSSGSDRTSPWSTSGCHRRSPTRGSGWPSNSVSQHQGLAILMFSQYIETRYAEELLGDDAAGIGYLLKDRVADVSQFVEALERVASGGTALDPEVVTQLMGASRRRDSISVLTARERDVLSLMAEGRTNTAIADSLCVSEGAVEKHVTNIFSKLDLPVSQADHRRVLAVLRYLDT